MNNITRILTLAGLAIFAMTVQAQTTPAPADNNPAPPPAITQPTPTPPATNPPPAEPVAKPSSETPPAVQPVAPPPPPVTAPVAPPPADAPPSSGAPTNAEVLPLIVIDDVALLDAVKNLARLAGLNFQFDPRVTASSNQPNVTIRFEHVTAEDALSAVLDNYGLAIQHDPKRRISKITLKDPRTEEPLLSKVFQLKYSSPTNLAPMLKAMLPTRCQVLPDARTAQLVVLAPEKELTTVEQLIDKLDTPTKQVLIEAQLWETAKNPQSMKGIDWSGTLEAQKVTFGNGNTIGTVNTRTPGDSTTTTLPGGRQITATDPISSTMNLVSSVGNGGLGLNTMMGLHPATAFLNADGLSAVISFLNKDTDTELVATPRAVTLDNQKARLDVTRAFPVYKITPGSANSPAGSEITWTNVGVILEVLPRIAANNVVALHVVPEVSDIAAIDRQVINGQPFTANIYGIRKVETHVMIPSGATLVMGGLLNDRSSKSYTKVPIIGDTPVFGGLFRKSEKKRDKNNLMIFVTPTIIEDSDFQVRQPSGFLKQQLKPEQVDQKMTAWDGGKPYDWTKPKAAKTEATKTPAN